MSRSEAQQTSSPLFREDERETQNTIKDTLPFDRCLKADKEFKIEQEEREIKEDLASFKSQLGLIKTTQSESKKAVFNWVGTDTVLRLKCKRYLFPTIGLAITFGLLFYALFCSLTGKPYINIEISVLMSIVSFLLSASFGIPKSLDEEFELVKNKMNEYEYLIGNNVVDCPLLIKYDLINSLWEGKKLYIRFVPSKKELQFFTNSEDVTYWFLKESDDKDSYDYQRNYFANQLIPNKFYTISDIITDKAFGNTNNVHKQSL